MKQTARIISTYTGDTSGVCSALYELGGLIVMHDPSGCNSTYSTHDEPRWYDMDSLIFISGLTEKDAIFGNDEKVISDTIAAAKELNPRFIAIAGTPIPYITGCDLKSIAFEIESRTGIPTFGFETDGMKSYVRGAAMAFSEYCKRMCVKAKKESEFSINILGVTPLDFSVNGSVKSMKNAFIERGIDVTSVIAMGSNYKDIENAGSADINLVVSSCGHELAKMFEKKFGTPYIIGTPYGYKFTDMLADTLKNKHKYDIQQNNIQNSENTKTVIIGESITSISLANALKLEGNIDSKVISAVETPREFISNFCINATDEDDILKFASDADNIIADPMYRPIFKDNVNFIELPHEAFSGRIYRNEIPNLIESIDSILNKLK